MSLFKSFVTYRLSSESPVASVAELEEVAPKFAFVPCAPTQQHSVGLIPPRGGESTVLVENVDGQLIFQLKVERKSVPGAAVKAAVEERCKQIEDTTGRKPGRKEKKDLKEEVLLDLLPRAFSKVSTHTVWLDRENHTLVVGAGSHRGADAVVDLMVQLAAETKQVLHIAPLHTQMSPAGAMAVWLSTQETPDTFDLGEEVELKSTDESKASVRYANHNLLLDEIRAHIEQGKSPTRLAMAWEGRVSFTLGADLGIRKFNPLLTPTTQTEGVDEFDANVALTTRELKAMIPALIEALGGEQVAEKPADSVESTEPALS